MAPDGSEGPRGVVFITIHYGDVSPTAKFIASVAAQRGAERCGVLVVNNDPRPAIAADLGRLLATTDVQGHLINAPGNLYYWPGAAYALDTLAAAALPEWIVVCNNDVYLDGDDFVDRLLRREPGGGGVLAPSIISNDTGRDQNPFLRRRLGSLARLKWRIYYTHYRVATAMLAVHGVWRGLRDRSPSPVSSGEKRDHAEERIYAPHGAFVIFARHFFERGGTLDTGFRMYGEEITVAETAARLGLDVVYCPVLRVAHDEHSTLGAALTREKYAMEREAYRHFSRTYWGESPKVWK